MLRHLTAALCFVAISTPGCTVVYNVPGPEAADTGSGSWTGWQPEPEQSTGELEESTGEESTSGGEAESTSTGIDDTSSSGTGDSSTGSTGDDESTSTGEPIEETSSTGEPPPPVGLPPNALCLADSDCASGVCLPNILSEDHADERRCSVPCVPDTTSCQDEGHSGLCLWGGNDQHWCIGVFPKAHKTLATPPPAEQGDSYFQDAYSLPSSEWSHFYLLPAHASEFYIEIGAWKGNGYGPVVVDLLSYDGATISTHTYSGQDGNYSYDKVFVQPKGAEYHYLKISAAEGVNLAKGHLALKNPYWPNNP